MFIFVLNIPASNIMIKHKIGHYPEGIKHWSGYVTYASEDVGHHAHKIILQALSEFPKIEITVLKTLNIGLIMLLLQAIIIIHIR